MRWPARALVAARVLAAWRAVAAIDDQLSCERVAAGVGGRRRDHVDATRRPRASCCPASCTRTTTGAGRSTRSCRRSRTSRWRRATRCLRRPARDRPAVDRRRARPAAARAARPARPAAGPARRPHGDRRRRRRPHAQRRGDRRRRRRRARPARPAAARLGALDSTRPGAPRARSGPVAPLPQVRAWDGPGAPPLVRVEPDAPPMVVDGSADGARRAGRLRRRCPRGRSSYAADVDAGRDPPRAARSWSTDGNRRRVFVVSRLVQNAGATLAADEPDLR